MKKFSKRNFFDGDSDFEYLKYSEKNGELHYEYRKSETRPGKYCSGSTITYKSNGRVPEYIVVQGEGAIKSYVKNQIRADVESKKEADRVRDEFIDNLRFHLEVEYDGVVLKGYASIDEIALKTTMTAPYQGEKFVIYGFGSAMAGHHILDENDNFTPGAISHAKKFLVEIYKEKKHYEQNKKIIDLKNKLNRKN